MDVNILGCDYVLANVKREELHKLLPIIQETAARADCIGIDEFPDLDSLVSVQEYEHGADLYGLYKGANIHAGFVVTASLYCRSSTRCLASILLFRSNDLSGPEHYRRLLRLAEGVAISTGYCCCETRVFTSDSEITLLLREEGYSVAVCMRDLVRQGNSGLVMSMAMYKDLGVTPPIVEAPTEAPKKQSDEVVTPNFPLVSFLPVEVTLGTGRKAVVRNMQSSECSLVYGLFMGAAGRGEGYSVDEYKSLDAFIEEVVNSYYSVVVEDAETGEVMAAFQFAETVFSRTKKTPVCDGHVVVAPKFAGKGFGQEACELLLSTCRQMGFTYMLNDTLLISGKVISILYRIGFQILGHMPRTAYVKNVGWIECLYFGGSLLPLPNITDWSPLNHKL